MYSNTYALIHFKYTQYTVQILTVGAPKDADSSAQCASAGALKEFLAACSPYWTARSSPVRDKFTYNIRIVYEEEYIVPVYTIIIMKQ